MTTPARNVNTIEQVTYGSFNGATGIWTNPAGSVPSSWFRDVRPISKTYLYQKGWRPCGPWSHWGYRAVKSGGTTYRIQPGSNPQRYQSGFTNGAMWSYAPQTTPPPPSNSLKAEAEVKALNKLKNQSIHVGVAVAEGKRTINMVASNILSIVKQVRNFKRNYPDLWKKVKKHQTGRCARQNWHKIPSKWLEIQYGWRPLLADILGGMEHLEKSFEQGALIRVGARASQPIVMTRNQGARILPNAWQSRVEGELASNVALWYVLDLPELAEVSSLGLINPLEIVWEMVPYSFVVDWLLPVGGWMSALTGDVGWLFKGGSHTSVYRADERFWRITQAAADFGIVGANPVLKGHMFSVVRQCYSSSPVPGFYLKNPFSSATRVANAIALLAVAFRR